jgi:uncharacterized membrane protein YdcZ (DUF606 family)
MVMKIYLVICFLLGALVVFQPSLNRIIFAQKGLSFAVFLNGSILFSSAVILFAVSFYLPDHVPLAQRFTPHSDVNWWYVLPGLMGFLLVVLVPIMIKNVGAFSTVVAMILGQVVTSILWDVYQEGVALSGSRLFGLLLVIAGAYFTFKPTM